jgi:hypothetical protein
MGGTGRLRRGEAGGARRRRASPASPPGPCSNICSTPVQGNPPRLSAVKSPFAPARISMSGRGLMRTVHVDDVVGFVVTSRAIGGHW